MRGISIFLSCFIFTALCFNCTSGLTDDFIGTWKAVSWTVEGEEKSNTNAVTFTFNSDDTYQAQYGSEIESGTFRVFGRNLYTTEEGKIEKQVKFNFDENLNLIFDMNRVGTSERMVLAKQVK